MSNEKLGAEQGRKRKYKFRVGQVVRADGAFLQVDEVVVRDNGEVTYDVGTFMYWPEKDLRALTKREAGR